MSKLFYYPWMIEDDERRFLSLTNIPGDGTSMLTNYDRNFLFLLAADLAERLVLLDAKIACTQVRP